MKRDIPRVDLYMARGGEAAVRQHCRVFSSWEVPERNALWVSDSRWLDIVVVDESGVVGSPHLTLVEDACTRVIVGWSCQMKLTSTAVIDALAMAFVGIDVDGVRVGGRPQVIYTDRGAENVNKHVSSVLIEFGDVMQATTVGYEPTSNGKVERAHQFIDPYLRTLPGFLEGPKDRMGKLLTATAGVEMMTLAELRAVIERAVHDYNCKLRHSSIGMTPIEKWANDPTDIEFLDPDRVFDVMTKSESRKVTSKGIHLFGGLWNALEVANMQGETLTVRYFPSRPDDVRAYRKGKFVAQLSPSAEWTHDERKRLGQFQRQQMEESRERIRRLADLPGHRNAVIVQAFFGHKGATKDKSLSPPALAEDDSLLDGPAPDASRPKMTTSTRRRASKNGRAKEAVPTLLKPSATAEELAW